MPGLKVQLKLLGPVVPAKGLFVHGFLFRVVSCCGKQHGLVVWCLRWLLPSHFVLVSHRHWL